MDQSSLEQIWQAILSEAELNMSKASFTTWFKNSFIFDYQDDILTIGVPNALLKLGLKINYLKTLPKFSVRLPAIS